jgi:hypothetical protein
MLMSTIVIKAQPVKRNKGWFLQVTSSTYSYVQKDDVLLTNGYLGRPDCIDKTKIYPTRKALREGVKDYNKRMHNYFVITGGLH